VGTGKGVALQLSGASEMYFRQIKFTLTADVDQRVHVAFGSYVKIADSSKLTNAIIKSNTYIYTSETTFTFELDKPEYYGYDTFYITLYNSNTADTITLKSIEATKFDGTINTYKFNTSVNDNTKEISFADEYWKTGQWAYDTGKWSTSTNRIGYTKKIPVREGARYTVTYNNGITPTISQVLVRLYTSGISSIADGDDLINSSIVKDNYTKTYFNIASSGTSFKIENGSGGAFILISLYGSSWNADSCATAIDNQLNDAYSLTITETFEDYTTIDMSLDGTGVTAPDTCLVNRDETLIGWRNDATGKLYPAGSVLTNEDLSDKTFTAVSAKVETQEGAGVRWSNTDVKRGLKFTTYITGNVGATELKNYISPALVKTVITGNGKTVEVLNSSAKDGNNEYADESNSTTLVYHGSVTEYQSDTSMLTVNFTAQGVATVTYADGSTMTLESSTTTTRNMYDVAQAAYNSLSSGSESSDSFKEGKMKLLEEVYLGIILGGEED
ncbi:MAG: hypothetical protein ACI396_02060, partial [Acutalibacteraceae bacterium]